MKRILEWDVWEDFEKEKNFDKLTKEQISFCKEIIIFHKFKVNDKGEVSTIGSISFYQHPKFDSFMGVQFADLNHDNDFILTHNELTSLKGSPKKVGGNFYVEGCKLKDLEGAPEYVGGDFSCKGNPLTSLKGMPKVIMGKFATPAFTMDMKLFDPKQWLNFLKSPHSEENKALAMTIMPDEILDEYFTKNPIEIRILDSHPDIKKGVIERTGIRDMSRLGRSIKSGLI